MELRKKLNPSQFRTAAANAIGKLGRNDTAKTGEAELKELFTKITEEQVTVVFSLLQETNEHLTLAHKREMIKVYGLMAEVMEGSFVPYIQRCVTILNKKLKEGDTHVQDAISLAFGQIVHNVLHTIPEVENSCKELGAIFKPLFVNLASQNKNIQIGSALCFTKIIQHAPLECLKFTLPKLSSKIIETLQSNTTKCQTQILETLDALILSVEADFSSNLETVIPVLFENIKSED